MEKTYKTTYKLSLVDHIFLFAISFNIINSLYHSRYELMFWEIMVLIFFVLNIFNSSLLKAYSGLMSETLAELVTAAKLANDMLEFIDKNLAKKDGTEEE